MGGNDGGPHNHNAACDARTRAMKSVTPDALARPFAYPPGFCGREPSRYSRIAWTALRTHTDDGDSWQRVPLQDAKRAAAAAPAASKRPAKAGKAEAASAFEFE